MTAQNFSGGKDSMTVGHGGFVVGAPIVRNRLLSFFSYETQVLNAVQEESFAVPTIEQRGFFDSGATGLFDGTDVGFPTTTAGDAIFSLFPFPNNPRGVYGRNTFTQTLPASARGHMASGKLDWNFGIKGKPQTFTVRYNYTNDRRDIPVTGGALFSTLRPLVLTHNVSTFLNSQITTDIDNQFRFSYGRTRLNFNEVRDKTFLLPSKASPREPFLLNAKQLTNLTLPIFDPIPVFYSSTFDPGAPTVEDNLGRIGQIILPGFSPVGVDVFNFPQRRVNNTFQFADTLTWRVVGGHFLSFGADIRRTELNSDLPRNSRTLLTFNGNPTVFGGGFLLPQDFAATGAPTGAFLSLADPQTGKSAIRLRYNQYNVFAQDEWRILPNLSLSYGLRYEYNTPPEEADGIIEKTFNSPALNNPAISGVKQFLAGRTKIFDPDRNNFAPRFSLAYAANVFGADKPTVLRVGYGLYYDQALGAVVSQSRNVMPNFLTVNTGGFSPDFVNGSSIGLISFFNPARGGACFGRDSQGRCTDFRPLVQPGTLNTRNSNLTFEQVLSIFVGAGSVFPNPATATLPSRVFEMPHAHHYSISVEQQIARDWVFNIAYVGTQGRDLLRTTTPNLGPNNIVIPLAVGLIDLLPAFVGVTLPPKGARPTSGLGAITIYETKSISYYDALQLQLSGRLSNTLNALRFQMNYTYSSARDDVSDFFDLAGASALAQNSITRVGERGPANFDARHRFTANFTYQLPTLFNRSRAMRFFLGGFELMGTWQYQTGQPFTVNSTLDVNLDGNLTDRLDNTNGLIVARGNNQQPLRLSAGNTLSLLAPLGTDGKIERNTFRAGDFFLANFAVLKNFLINDRHRVSFRAEALNLFDRNNFNIPVRYLEAPGFGQATETVTPGRRIQFALKYSF
jgi:hypothetical protein